MMTDTDKVAETSTHKAVELSQQIMHDIRKLLASHPPEIQGAAMADLLAIFIAGHHPDIRETIFTMHIDAVRRLIPVNVELIKNRHPGIWDKK